MMVFDSSGRLACQLRECPLGGLSTFADEFGAPPSLFLSLSPRYLHDISCSSPVPLNQETDTSLDGSTRQCRSTDCPVLGVAAAVLLVRSAIGMGALSFVTSLVGVNFGSPFSAKLRLLPPDSRGNHQLYARSPYTGGAHENVAHETHIKCESANFALSLVLGKSGAGVSVQLAAAAASWPPDLFTRRSQRAPSPPPSASFQFMEPHLRAAGRAGGH